MNILTSNLKNHPALINNNAIANTAPILKNIQTIYNFAAESSLLGALLFNNNAIQNIDESLLAKHFYVPIHAKIFEFINSLHNKGLLASVITISSALSGESFFQNNQSAAEEYLENLVHQAVMSTEVDGLAKHLFDLALKRQLIDISNDMISKLNSNNTEHVGVMEHIVDIEKQLADLAMHGDANRQYKTISDITYSVLEKIDLNKKNAGKLLGMTTGFNDMDKMLAGLQASDLIIIAARPAMGKTAFALSLALNAAEHIRDSEDSQRTVAFFSLEMSDEQLVTRLISMKSGINANSIRLGQVKDEEFSRISLACNNISELHLLIDDNPTISITEVRNRARRMMRKEKLGAIFIDYLQLLSGTAKSSLTNRVNEISEISRGLKALAKEFNIPVIALSQLSREVEKRSNKRPHLSDLRESGSIEQDADIVMFLYREEYYLLSSEPQSNDEKYEKSGGRTYEEDHDLWKSEMERLRNTAEIIVSKHRNGPVGSFRLIFDHETTAFKDPINFNYDEFCNTSD